MRRCLAILFSLVILPILADPQPVSAQPSLTPLWKTEYRPASTVVAVAHKHHWIAYAQYHAIYIWDDDRSVIRDTITSDYTFAELRFSEDDKSLVGLESRRAGWSLAYNSRSNVGVIIFNISSHKEERAYITRPHSFEAALSSDGRFIAALDESGALSLYAPNGQLINVHDLPGRKIGPREYFQTSITFNPGDKTVTAITQKRAYVVTVRKLSRVREIRIGTDSEDSLAFQWFTLSPESVFLSSHSPEVIVLPSGTFSTLQPPAPVHLPGAPYWQQSPRARDAVLTDDGKLLISRYEAVTWAIPIDGPGPREGIDSLVFQTSGPPERWWSIRVSPGMTILGPLPWKPGTLLMSDGGKALLVYPKLRRIDTLAEGYSARLLGFSEDARYVITTSSNSTEWHDTRSGRTVMTDWGEYGESTILSPAGTWLLKPQIGGSIEVRTSENALVSRAPLNRSTVDVEFLDSSYALIRLGGATTPALYNLPSFTLRDSIPELARFWKISGSAGNVLLASSPNYRSDTAHLYDWIRRKFVQSFLGGLNYGISTTAISHDLKWVITVNAATNDTRLWSAANGSLHAGFRLPETRTVEFTPNDRYFITLGGGYYDSCLLVVDPLTGDRTQICVGPTGLERFDISNDGRYLAVGRRGLLEVYLVPEDWRNPDPLKPTKTYLPLRFYIPANAREALDSTGLPYNPRRTDVILELRYADGRVIQRILNGNFHSGKWAEWTYDVSGYPKGSYIMHTEIGGVIKDEQVVLR